MRRLGSLRLRPLRAAACWGTQLAAAAELYLMRFYYARDWSALSVFALHAVVFPLRSDCFCALC